MFDVSSFLFFSKKSQSCSCRCGCVHKCGLEISSSFFSFFLIVHVCSARTHTQTQTHIQAVATGLLLPRRQINAFRSQCQYNVFVYLSSAWLLPSTQTDRHPQHHLCLFIIDQGEAVTPEGLRHGNFFFFSPHTSPSIFLVFSSCLLRITMY